MNIIRLDRCSKLNTDFRSENHGTKSKKCVGTRPFGANGIPFYLPTFHVRFIHLYAHFICNGYLVVDVCHKIGRDECVQIFCVIRPIDTWNKVAGRPLHSHVILFVQLCPQITYNIGVGRWVD